MDNIFIQLAVILGLSSVFGLITKLLKLPLVIAYLAVGLVLAATSAFDIHASNALSFLPEIGIAFMLFLVGMELDLRELRNLGKPILVSGLIQIFITAILGSIIANFFNFGTVESWYLGVGLSFSSTVVVVKLLADKRELTSLYGKLSLGILLLEDILAVFILLVLTSSPSIFELGLDQAFPLLMILFKALLVFGISVLVNKYLLTHLFNLVAESGELLFLTALAWCFVYISLAMILGFSVLIGAFLAGVALAASPYHLQIQGKIKPLRDFFVSLFFVYLGTQVNFDYLEGNYLLILIFTLYALFIKPIIFLLCLGMFGFRKHTMFKTAINMSQISEFSLIMLVIGLEKTATSPAALTVIALTGVLSMLMSSIMIFNSKRIYKYMSRLLGLFERNEFNHLLEGIQEEELKGHIVIIGGHRVGGEIIKLLKREKIPQIVLDFNPHQVQALLNDHIPVLYGDMGDPEILDALDLHDSRMVISTSSNLEDNKLLLEELRTRKIKVPVITRSETVKEALELYKCGSDFVIIPEVLAGDFLVEKLKKHLEKSTFLKDSGDEQIAKLTKKTFAWE